MKAKKSRVGAEASPAERSAKKRRRASEGAAPRAAAAAVRDSGASSSEEAVAPLEPDADSDLDSDFDSDGELRDRDVPASTPGDDGAGGDAPEKKKPVLTAKALAKAKRDVEKRGIVYLGSVPPRMKPQKLRQLLTPYGALDRMFLTPEDPSVRLRRKKFGGNTGKNFTEGWVEFRDKKKARRCAEMLNGRQIGGKRRNAHYSDLWNIRYLPKFKWDNLTEEIEYQKALREQKLALELAVAKKERDFYLAKVEQSKQFAKMEARRAAIAADPDGDHGDGPPLDREETKEEYEARMKRETRERRSERDALLRRFKQRAALGDVNLDETRGMLSPDVLKDLFVGSAE
jgi:ESF2/ABP1 family protein